MFNENYLVEAIEKMRMRRAGRAIKSQNLYRTVLEWNPVGKRLLGRPKLRWENIVKRDVEELGGGLNLNDSAKNYFFYFGQVNEKN